MAIIVTRAGKGSPLTNAEMDDNLTGLNNELVVKAVLTANTFTGAQKWATAAAIASAATVNLNAATTGNRAHITGTVEITAWTLTGGPFTVIFDAATLLTYHATTNRLNSGARSYTTAAGDTADIYSDGTTVFVNITKLAGTAVVGGTTIRSARTANTILGTADNSTLIDITSGTFSQTFTAAATLASGWFCYIRNSGTGDITLDPDGTELIDGLATYIMYPNETRLVQCTGAAFTSAVLSPFSRTFTASDTFTKPPGYANFGGLLWGGGGGGGGGNAVRATGTTGSVGSSGSGGGGGQFVLRNISGSLFAATETVTVGAAGAAGAGGTTGTAADASASALGTAGTAGGSSSIGSLLTAAGGNGGGVGVVGGASLAVVGGLAGGTLSGNGGSGGGSAADAFATAGDSVSRGANGRDFGAGGGGGAGAASSVSTVQNTGGAGGVSPGTGTAGAAGTGYYSITDSTTLNRTGTATSGTAGTQFCGGGGGGGAHLTNTLGTSTLTSSGGDGAGGLLGGGGGGGGSASVNNGAGTAPMTATSGAGGAGGIGRVEITGA